jgi:hypothetical protein
MSRRVRGSDHAARKGQVRNAYNISARKIRREKTVRETYG